MCPVASVPTLLSTAAVVHILLSLVLLLWHNVVDFVLMCQMPMALIACCRMPMTLPNSAFWVTRGSCSICAWRLEASVSSLPYISRLRGVQVDVGWGLGDGRVGGWRRSVSIFVLHKWGRGSQVGDDPPRHTYHLQPRSNVSHPTPPRSHSPPRQPGSVDTWASMPKPSHAEPFHMRAPPKGCVQCLYRRVPPVSIYARAANVYKCVARQCALVIAAELKNAG